MTPILIGALLASILLQADAAQRSAAEVAAFKRANPCPSTGLRRGACPGHQVDHIEPLCAGGPDTRENMQWLTVAEHRVKTRYDVRLCRLIQPNSGRRISQ